MKDYNIEEIKRLTEAEARQIADATEQIKGHTVYFADLGSYFGYSALVYINKHHIHYANDYELHHKYGKKKSADELRALYKKELNLKLFTEEEIAEPLKDYDEYERKRYFIHNYYGMRHDHISAFCIGEKEQKRLTEQVNGMIYNPVAFAYYATEQAPFIRRHIELVQQLKRAKDGMNDSFEYWKGAFLREMWNHEYGYSAQGDWDVLNAFGNIPYRAHVENELQTYFDDLRLNKTQRNAYLAAREDYLAEFRNRWC